MKRRILGWLGLALIASAALTVPPAFADSRRGSGGPPSVFPAPRDPWRSWGVHKELPRHLPPPRHYQYGRHYGGHVSAPHTVWVPGQWVWDGYYSQWVWSPGYWRRY